MIIVLGFTVLSLVSFIVWLLTKEDYNLSDFTACICIGFFSVWVIVVVLVLPVQRICVPAQIVKIESVRVTILDARGNVFLSKLELAAITAKVVETNKEIVNMKYWASNPLTSWFWPKEAREIRLIR